MLRLSPFRPRLFGDGFRFQFPQGQVPAVGSRAASLLHFSLSLAAAPQLSETPSCTAALSVLKPISWSSRVRSCP
jgi:hypothetical protein